MRRKRTDFSSDRGREGIEEPKESAEGGEFIGGQTLATPSTWQELSSHQGGRMGRL